MPQAQHFGAGVGDFYPGTIRAGRLFGVTDDGILASPFQVPATWFTAEHDAAVPTPGNDYWNSYRVRRWKRIGGVQEAPGGWHASRCPVDCDTGRPKADCSCGFYTFFTKPDRYMSIDHPYAVDAIVEGKGKVVVGELGARLGEMRIQAVVVEPQRGPIGMVGLIFKEYFRTLMRRDPKAFIVLFWLMWAVFWAIATSLGSSPLWAKIIAVIMYSLIGVGWMAMTVLTVFFRQRKSIPKKIYQLMRTEYPDIEFFTTWKEAAKKYPLSDPNDFQKES